ncbi:MAG TPA: GNAT family N-acetyltransferase [Acidimicrobiales bacterium]|nr:GNAT family N-acetyltransferase [Acidimicrobiales bacterium]
MEVVSGPTLLDDLGADLDELHELTDAPITARRTWLGAWLGAFAQGDPTAVTVRDGPNGRLDAVALLCARETDGLIEVGAVGHGRNDRGRLPARTPGACDALVSGLVGFLDSLGPEWSLRVEQLPANDPVASRLVKALEIGFTVPGGPVPRIEFEERAGALEELLGKGMRKQLRRAKGRMENEGVEASLAFDCDPDRIADLIDEIEETHRARDHAVGRASDIDAEPARRFWRDVIGSHAERREVEVATLRFGSSLAAYVVSLIDGESYRVLDGRFDTQWSRFSPGRVVETATLEKAFGDARFSNLDWMNSVASEKLVAANYFEATEHLVGCSRRLAEGLALPELRALLDEDAENRPTAERALAALLGRVAREGRPSGPSGSSA